MELIAPAPPAPAEAASPAAAPAGAFLSGVLVSQVANGALHLAQPLLIAHLTGSYGKAALFSSFDTAVHMGGTALGGWPCDKMGSRRVLSLSALGRGAALAAIPAAWLAGRLTPAVAMAAYTLDALVRGLLDTAVHTLPMELGAGDRAQLDRLNARYELAFDIGGIAGPLLLGGLMLGAKGVVPHAAVPLGFAAAAALFWLVPERHGAPAARSMGRGPRGGTAEGLRLVLTDGTLLWTCLGLSILNLYPLRKLLSAFFAKAILSKPAAVGVVGAAFGLGGAAGSILYGARRREGSGAAWVAAGGVGALLLAVGWVPSALWPMAAAAFAFSFTNVCARLALTTTLQEATPMGAAGGVTAVARFGANGASVGLKALVGVAFLMGAGPRAAFAAVGCGLALIAAAQLALAARLRSKSR